MKTCNKCKELKPYTEFHRNRARKGGYHNECKACKRELDREYLAREDVKERGKEYKRERVNGTAKQVARLKVRDAVQKGKLPPVTELTCAMCGAQARERHHLSYEKSIIVDLCTGCHGVAHRSDASEEFIRKLWENSYRLDDKLEQYLDFINNRLIEAHGWVSPVDALFLNRS